MNLLRKLATKLKASRASTAWEKQAIWLTYEKPDEFAYDENSLDMKVLGFKLPKGEMIGLFKYYDKLKAIKKLVNANFTYKEKGIDIEFLDLHIHAQTAEDFFIIYEIFIQGDYNFRLPNSNTIVVDIGMNVGLASLFFARHEQVKKIYAYEPFLPTYKQALSNLELNPKYKSKIEAINYGLGDKDEELELHYNYDNKGSVGVYGKDFSSFEKHSIHLKSTHTELKKILTDYPDHSIILKIDCEGGEYAIFEDFKKYSIPENVVLIMMEWHRKGAEPLVQLLEKGGFSSFVHNTYSNDLGMIYAVRTKF